MGRIEDGKPYRWGQVYAALLAVKGLAESGRVEPVPERRLRAAAGRPLGEFEALLPHLGLQILAARQKGGAVAGATATAAGDVARFMPPERMSWSGLGPSETAGFQQGYEERIAAYRREWEALVR
ncbi:hypothetical protein ACIRQY_28195 [Streptomyces sp. NPDC101490]|uniref:hypothetical protein n=1 Tax=Streptomyces sp. NPDC101490 TaxID=3366143 RepID=UPI003828632A